MRGTVFDKDASEATVTGYLVKGNRLVMPKNGTTVLAVWASDVNGNGTADFRETAVSGTLKSLADVWLVPDSSIAEGRILEDGKTCRSNTFAGVR